jgi:iron complex outermembrane recepter protein
MNKKNRIFLAVRLVSLAIVGTAVISTPNWVMAQSENVKTEGQSEADLEEIFVTGSRISRDEFSGPAPVVSLDASEIKAGGYVSIQEVLSSMTQNSGGGLTQQSVHGFTPAASGVDLRGAGIGRTLTLIDGRRTAAYPIAFEGKDNFVDIANIPIGAVERIEVLTSGASAIYGSDAMGGVINIILKKDFDGVEISSRLSDTAEGGRDTQQFSLTAGTSSEKGNMLFFLEHETRDRLAATDRENFDLHTDLAFDHAKSSYSSIGASIMHDRTAVKTISRQECSERGLQYWDYGNSEVGGICGFNRTTMRDLLPEQDRTSAMFKFNYAINDSMNFHGNLSATRANLKTQVESMGVTSYLFHVKDNQVTATWDKPDASILEPETAVFDQATAFDGDFADLEDGTYNYRRRMLEFGPRENDVTTENFGLNAGIDGTLPNGIDYNADLQYSRIDVNTQSRGFASYSGFFKYLTGQTNNNPNGNSLLKPIDESDVEATRYTPWEQARSTLRGGSLGFRGDAFDLPAGAIKWAAGVEYYEAWFSTEADEPSKNNEILTTGAGAGAGYRDWTSAYTELLIPVIKQIDITVAARFDEYSDFGSATTPQFAVEYRPTDNLLIRGLYAETFRAPDLQRIYGEISYASEQVYDTYGCLQSGGKPGDPKDPNAACNGELYVDTQASPNPDLTAEEGESWNVGIVYDFEFAGEWNISADYWTVSLEHVVNDLQPQTILDEYKKYDYLVERDENGVADTVRSKAENLSVRETAGVDFAVAYSFTTSLGTFNTKLSSTYLSKWDEQFKQGSEFDDITEDKAKPQWRSNVRFGWEYHQWSASMLLRYVGEMNGEKTGSLRDLGNLPEEGYTIDEYATMNLSTAFSVNDQLTLSAGINNVTDEGPNEDPTENGWPHYQRVFFDPVGREYYGRIDFKF